MPEETKEKNEAYYRNLLVEDILDRYQRRWGEDAISREKARTVLEENLDRLVGEVKGPGRVGLAFGLDPGEKLHPMFIAPRLAGASARQDIAFRLHEIIGKQHSQ